MIVTLICNLFSLLYTISLVCCCFHCGSCITRCKLKSAREHGNILTGYWLFKNCHYAANLKGFQRVALVIGFRKLMSRYRKPFWVGFRTSDDDSLVLLHWASSRVAGVSYMDAHRGIEPANTECLCARQQLWGQVGLAWESGGNCRIEPWSCGEFEAILAG